MIDSRHDFGARYVSTFAFPRRELTRVLYTTTFAFPFSLQVTRGCALHAAALLSDAHRAAPAAGRRRVVAVAHQLTDCVSRPVRALVRFVVQGDSGRDSNSDKLRSDSSSSGDSEDENSASSSNGNDDTDGGNQGDSSSSSGSSSGGGVSSSKAIAVTVCRAGATLPSATEVSVPISSHHRDNLVAIVVDLFEGTELPSSSGGNSGSNDEGGGFLGRFVAHGPKAQPATSLIPRGSSAVESSSLRLRFALRAGDGVATVQAAAIEWSTLSKVEKVPVASNATSTNSSDSSSSSSQSSDSSATTNNSSAEEKEAGKETLMNDDSTGGAESATTPSPPPPPPPPPRRSSMALKVTSVGLNAASQPSTSSAPLPPALANVLAAPSVPPPPYFACPLLAGEALDAAVARERASRRADAAAVSAAKAVNELEASVSVARQELEDFEFDSESGGNSDSSSNGVDSDSSIESADVWNKLAAESVALCSDRNKEAGVELEVKSPPSLAFCLGANGRAALQHAVEDASNFLDTSPLERLSTHGLSASLEVVSQGRQHAESLASVLAPATAVQTAAVEWRAEQMALWKALRELEAALGDPPPTVRSTTTSSSGTSSSENKSGNSNGHGGSSGRGSISGLFGPKGSSGQPRRPRTESNTAASARQAAAEVRNWLLSAPLKGHPLQAQSMRRRPGEKALNRNEALVAAATAVGGDAQQKRATLEVWSTQLRTSSQATEGAATLGAQARAAAADVQRTAAGLFGATGKGAGGDGNSPPPKNPDNTNR